MRRYQSLISVNTLAGNLNNPAFRVVDCRFSLAQPEQGLKDYRSGHIPGASYANLDTDLAAPITAGSGRHPLPEVETFVDCLRRWGLSNDSQLVVYDDAGGGVAARLWWMLRWLGHQDVALLDGGFAAWTRANQPVSQDETAPPAGSFSGSAAVDRIWSSAQIESWLVADSAFTLVDARAGARFRGEQEPIDPVAGHVPGALNLPFTDTLNADGTWREKAEIKACWANIGVRPGEKEWGVMCGSGVTACHLALSASMAGLPEPCLYVGSWSEWLQDPARPIVAEHRAEREI
ncbi:MAG: sulfurtransferase [Gammaproteobacteria bacterium]|nr:sulfurtransferase [Gammaproteobacteria bacterium]